MSISLTGTSSRSLRDAVSQARSQTMEQAGNAMLALSELARNLKMDETAKGFNEIREGLANDSFNLMVVGRFKNGKSTLVNSLLGRPTVPVPGLPGGTGPMPVDDLPATATLTRVVYSERPYVRRWNFDGTSEQWPMAKYLEESTVRANPVETEEFFSPIREFEFGYPSSLCKPGITLIDSPGTFDTPQRTIVTTEAVKRSDAAIVVYRSDVIAGSDETQFVDDAILGSGTTRIFTVINIMKEIRDLEKFKRFAWHRLVNRSQPGPEYCGQDLAQHGIYLVNALQAEHGSLNGDRDRVVRSGLGLLESDIGRFLAKDRHLVHIQKFVNRAISEARSLEKLATQRQAALHTDTERLRQRLAEVKPQLEVIRRRRANLERIFVRYQQMATSEVFLSFRNMVNSLRTTLPTELDQVKLPCMEGWMAQATSIFRQKQLAKELREAAQTIVTRKLKDWAQDPQCPNGAQASLRRHASDMLDEVTEEVAQIDRGFQQINLTVSGPGTLGQGDLQVISLQERLAAGALGLIVGDLSALFGAGGGGLPSVGANLAGQLGAAALLWATGLAGGPLFIPAVVIVGWLGSIVGSKFTIVSRLKAKVAEEACKALAEQAASTREEELGRAVASTFGELQQLVMVEVDAAITAEEAGLQAIIDDCERSHSDKLRLAESLESAIQKARAQKKELEASLVLATQAC